MADPSVSKGRPLVVGANHRSSSMGLRDRLFVEDSEMPGFLGRLRRAGFDQALVLSTCDRIEVQAVVAGDGEGGEDGEDGDARRIVAEMAGFAGIGIDELAGHTYVLAGEAALRHIFAVTASLDSLMIGEPQVLGQVKAGHRQARDAGLVGSELEAVMQAAYGAAKRVRNETAIGQHPVSMAAAAVQVARDLHGDLSRCAGLLVGVGDMGQLVAADLVAAGLGHLGVTHPAESRAEDAARALDCHVTPFDGLAGALAEADIVIASMGSRRYALSAEMIEAGLRRRRRKPVFLVDTAVPGDVEPAVARIEEAFLYDLNDLERIVMEGRAGRQDEAAAAWRIVDEEVAGFLRGRAERAAVPALTRLRRHFEAIRDEVLAEAGDDAPKATRLLVNRLLHDPSRALREAAAEGRSDPPPGGGGQGEDDLETAERVLGRLFGLDGDDGGDPR